MKDENSPIADEILRSLRRIVQRITIHSRQLYRQTGLTVTQVLCLRTIAESDDEEVTAAHVSRQVQLRPATVTGILDRLQRDGLIERERRSRDRRKVCLSLTDKGRERVADLPQPLQDRFVQRLMGLEEPERRDLLAALHRLVDMMEAGHLEASPILVTGEVDAKAAPPR